MASAQTRAWRRLATVVAVFGVAEVAAAQKAERVVGRVASEYGEAIADATIDVEGTFWHTVSRRDGAFILSVPPGQWTLRVRRVGFAPATRVVLANAAMRDSILVVLLDAPNELRGVVVRDERTLPLVSTITAETARQAPPLGEPDILRVLPMLPAVLQPNDLSGRIHLAGGASDEQAVSLDGHPLQAPYHVHSVFGAFTVSALERADVLIHHVPSALEGHLSGAINLETKRATPAPAYEAVVSLLSSSLTASLPSVAGGVDVLASGRVTYMDRVLGHFTQRSGQGGDDLTLPSYRDMLLKVGREWDRGFSVEMLGYGTLDYWATARGDSSAPSLRWGETLVGVRAGYRSATWDIALRASTDRAFAASQRRRDLPQDTIPGTRIDFVDLTQRWSTTSLEIRRHDRRWQANAGAKLDLRNQDQRWAGALARDLFKSSVPSNYAERSRQAVLGLFGEGSLSGTSSWSATLGGHVSVVEGSAYLAPRLLASVQLSPATRVQLALNRRHQFDAIAAEPSEGSITQPVFLLRVPRVADMSAVSVAWRPSPSTSGRRVGAEIAMYARRYHDRLIPDSAPPATGCSSAPPPGCADPVSWRRVPGSTLGASLTGDVALANGTIVQGSYTRQQSREVVAGQARPTSWDAPHQLALFTGVSLGARWTLTGVGQVHSGAAVTPVAARLFVPEGGGRFGQRFVYGSANSARLPSYIRVDLGLRHKWTGWGARWALSLQALNVLSRTNVMAYDWRNYFACASISECRTPDGGRRGLPILPSVGLEARW